MVARGPEYDCFFRSLSLCCLAWILHDHIDQQTVGATVLRGPMGFGAASRIHTAKILRLSMDLPIVIEIVDSEEKLNELRPDLERMIGGGLVTLEKIKVIHYRHNKPD